jgi:uncharacterized Zn finger protein
MNAFIGRAGTALGNEPWWAKLWIHALEQVLDSHAARLQRGRTYAQTGRVSNVNVSASTITARVTGTRIYAVTITVGQLSDREWSQVLTAMAGQAQYSAALLSGQIPTQTVELFRSLGVALLPTTSVELQTSCSCQDWVDPCKHVAAVHYVLAEALAVDPFLLLELRGRNRQQVLATMRTMRAFGASSQDQPIENSRPMSGHRQRGQRKVADVSQTVESTGRTRWSEEQYDALQAPLPLMQFSFDGGSSQPVVTAPTITQLRTPAGWTAEKTPAELFAPMLKATASFAQAIAAAEQDDIESHVQNPSARRSQNRPSIRRK